MSKHIGFCARALCCLVLSIAAPCEAEEEYGWPVASDFLQSYCIECHQGEDSEADLDLDEFSSLESLESQPRSWRKLLLRVREHEMPPKESTQPDAAERAGFSSWLELTLRQAACGSDVKPAPAVTRRLNRDEYGNTVRDLLDIHVNVALTLPADGAGGEGFDNAAETLFISPIHAEKYLDAAQSALEHAFREEGARNKLLPTIPGDAGDSGDAGDPKAILQAAQEALAKFLPRAFRRPVTEDEIQGYLAIFADSFEGSSSFVEAMKVTMTSAMLSPKFLFRVERPGTTEQPEPLSDHELASRLSYFLWASMPDEELLAAADAGLLSDEAELRKQVDRMLGGGKVGRSSNRVSGFATSFVEQWLGTRALGREFKPDPKVARRYNSELEGAMKYEPVLVFEEILIKDHSILRCIDADFTYANKSLARHYGIKGEFREQPRRVELKEKDRRGGFVTMASVLAISSYPHRTSPVLRGKWILETLLGAPPAPPPPDVPELDETVSVEQPKSLRDRLEAHRERAECAVCHDRIDPLGFGLANYDVLGRYRRIDSGKFINSRGRLPDGTEFEGADGLKQALLARKDQFAEHLTAKMLGFALGRSLRDEDWCTIGQIVEELKANDYSSHALVWGIVRSVPFRYKAKD